MMPRQRGSNSYVTIFLTPSPSHSFSQVVKGYMADDAAARSGAAALEGLTLGNDKGLPWLNAATVQV